MRRVAHSALVLALSLSLGVLACSRREAPPSSEGRETTAPTAAPPARPAPTAEPAAVELAFETGESLAQVQARLEPAIAAGVVRVERATSEPRTLRASTLTVTEQALAITGDSPVEAVRLVYFEGTLVSVVQTWRDPRPALAEALTAELGAALEADGWRGWWDPQGDRIVQLRDEGRLHEVFDLAAASGAVPEIRLAMLESWVARYGQPPPWAAAP